MVEQSSSGPQMGAFRVAAGLGFLAVALGAFGAHSLKDFLLRQNMGAVWDKAVFYHMVHAVVMIWVAGLRPFPAAAWRWFGVGVLCFSGSLYAWALTQVHWLVFVTPLGGLCLLAGWLSLVIYGGRGVNNELS